MKTQKHFTLAGSIALLIAASPGFAVTFTWDGGGANDTFSTAANWVGDVTLVSNISTTDFVFAGTTRLTPVLGAGFAANSIVFNNTAGAFTITGASPFTIGAAGITNNDSQSQAINNGVSVGVPSTSVNATSGPLTFGNMYFLGANTTTITGGFSTSFVDIQGTGTVVKTGSGTTTWSPGPLVSRALNFDINAGNFTLASTSQVTLTAGGSLDIAGGTFQNNGTLILDNVAMTRTSGLLVNNSSASLTLQNGATYTTSVIGNGPGGNVLLTGAGTAYTATGSQSMPGATWMVSGGASLSTGSFFDIGGTSAIYDLRIIGAGSSFTTGGSQSFWGFGAGSQTLVNIASNATGTFNSGFNLAQSSGAVAELRVESGATVTSGGPIAVGTTAGSSALMSVSSATWTHNAAGSLSIGAASGTVNTGTLSLLAGAVFTTGTGTTTVNPFGVLNVDNSALAVRGNMNIAGGKMVLKNANFTMDAGRTLTVSNGGKVEGQSAVSFNSAATMTLTGAGTEFVVLDGVNRSLSFGGGSTINVNSGAKISMEAFATRLEIGSASGNATVNLDGTDSRISSSSPIYIGGGGGVGTVSLSNNARITANSQLLVGGDMGGAGSGGSLTLLSGATVSTSSIIVGNPTVGTTSTLNISGANSVYGSSFVSTVGFGGAGSVTIGAGGRFNAGDQLYIEPTGAIQVNTGGTLSVGPINLQIAGGSLNVAAGGVLLVSSLASINVVNGGALVHGGTQSFAPQGTVSVQGAGAQISMPGVPISIGAGDIFIFGGASMSVAALQQTGGTPARSLTVSGAGSSLTVAPTGIFQLGHVSASISDNATAALGRMRIDPGSMGFADKTTTLTVSGGADVTSQSMALGTLTTAPTPGTGAVVVSGAGATYTVDGGEVGLGGTNASQSTRGVLTIEAGAVFTGPTAFTSTINQTGTLNIHGGTAIFRAPLLRNGGTINFTSGTLQIVDNFAAGATGLLGATPTLNTGMNFTTSGTTTLEPGGQLVMNGGSFSTGALANTGGSLAFNSGTLSVTGPGGFALQSGGPLGSSMTLGEGKTLNVSNATAIASGATLRLNGGAFTGGTVNLAANGTMRLDLGIASVGNVINSGRVFVADTLQVTSGFTNQTGGRVTLESGTGQIFGAGPFTNSGLVTGDGTIATTFGNATGGEVRAEFGKTLTFTGNSGNSGRLNLLGGTVQFTQPLSNAVGGEINGEGALHFPTSPVPSSADPSAGLNNAGNLNFSGGDTQVYGTVAMLAGSRLIVSGGATASFYDVFRHNGLEVKASALSSLVFFDEVRGAGSFTGGGTIYMEGGYSPGNSPASVVIDAGIVLSPSNTLTLEIGGITEGIEFDHLDLGPLGSLVADGTLVLDFFGDFAPEIGQIFDLIDFAPEQVSGSFDNIVVNANLAPGVALDTSEILTTGSITVVPEPSGAILLLGGLATLLTRRRRH